MQPARSGMVLPKLAYLLMVRHFPAEEGIDVELSSLLSMISGMESGLHFVWFDERIER
jgi:hypothetical protein